MAKHIGWGSTRRKLPVDDSGIVTEFITHAHEPGKIYTKRTQIGEDKIYERNRRIRNDKLQKDLSFGRHVANIPWNEYMRLKKEHPELSSKDKDLRNSAWAKILKDPDNKKFLTVPKY